MFFLLQTRESFRRALGKGIRIKVGEKHEEIKTEEFNADETRNGKYTTTAGRLNDSREVEEVDTRKKRKIACKSHF